MSWLLRRRGDGRQYGPLNDATVRRWAWDGYIRATDELSEDNGVTWVCARELGWLTSFLIDRDPAPTSVGADSFAEHRRLPRRKGSLLDLTPMIDCVFLLLLFFFVTATFEEHESSAMAEPAQASADVNLDVSVPRVAEKPPRDIESPRQLHVVVAADGSIVFEGQSHSLRSLQQAIRERQGGGRPITVIVLASPDVQYRHIARTVAAIEAAGVERVLLGAAGPDE